MVILSLARLTTVAFGVATVVGVHIAGRLLHNRTVGWLSAILLAASPVDRPMTARLTSRNRKVLARDWTCDRIGRERVTFVLLSSAFTHAVHDPRAAALQDCVQRRAASLVTISPLHPGVTVPEFELSDMTDILPVLDARASGGPMIRIFEITPP